MTLRPFALALVALVVCSAVAVAGPTRSFGIGASIAVPTGVWSDVAGTGFGLVGAYDRDVNERFGFGVDVAFQHGDGRRGTVTDGLTTVRVKVDTNLLEAGAHVRYLLPLNLPGMSPFVRAGIGVVDVNQRWSSAVVGGSSWAWSGSPAEWRPAFDYGLGATIEKGARGAIEIAVLDHIVPIASSTKLVAGRDANGKASALNVFTASLSWRFLLAR